MDVKEGSLEAETKEPKSATKWGPRDPSVGQLQQASSWRGISSWATVAPPALTLVLGGAFLGRASLSTDEAATWVNSTQPVSEIVRNSSHVDVMFLPYYLFMHFWLGLSQSLFWMRLPSLLTGAGAVLALGLLARRFLPASWSALAGLLLVFNPLFVQYTIEARPYTAATLFAVLSTAALVKAIDRPGALRWVRYGVFSLCMLVLHLLAVFVLVAQLTGVVVARRRQALRPMALTLACVAVAISPLAILSAGETSQISWIPRSTLQSFLAALRAVSGARVDTAGLLICGIIVVAVISSSAPGSDEALGAALFLSWGGVPPLLLVLVGFVHPLYVDHYTVVCLPGIALVEAVAARRAWTILSELRRRHRSSVAGQKASAPLGPLDRLGSRRWVLVVAAVTLVAAGVGGLGVLASNTNQVLKEHYYVDDYRSAAAGLSSDVLQRPASVVIIPNWAGVGFSYYATPPALAHALGTQATSALDRNRIDWQMIPVGRHDESSVLRLPVGAERETPTARCVVGWANGRGPAPSTTFVVNGSRCRLSHVQYYGPVWVARAVSSGRATLSVVGSGRSAMEPTVSFTSVVTVAPRPGAWM